MGSQAVTSVIEFGKANPNAVVGFQTAAAVTGGIGVGAVPILSLFGFTAIGPTAGSAAAYWMSSTGVVQAGSLLATCQSAAMGGVSLVAVHTGGALGLTAAVLPSVPNLVSKAASWFK